MVTADSRAEIPCEFLLFRATGRLIAGSAEMRREALRVLQLSPLQPQKRRSASASDISSKWSLKVSQQAFGCRWRRSVVEVG